MSFLLLSEQSTIIFVSTISRVVFVMGVQSVFLHN